MKLAIISTGGIQRRTQIQIKYLEREGIDTKTIAPKNPIHKIPRGKATINKTLQKLLITDLDAFTLPAALAQAKKKKPDAILITLPPFSQLHIAPRLAKLAKTTPVILEYRDPWLESYSYNPPTHMHHTANTKIQSQAMKEASTIIVPNHHWHTTFKARYPEHRDKIRCIPHSYDPEDYENYEDHEENEKMTWTWAGTMLPQHDTTIITQIARYIRYTKTRDITIKIAGRISPAKARQITKEKEKAIQVQILGNLPHREAIKLMCQSDALILPPTLHREGIPSRTPEHIRSKTPILTNTTSKETEELIKKTKSGTVATKPWEIREEIRKMHEDWKDGKPKPKPDLNPLKKYDARTNTKKLIQILEEIT